MLTRTQGKAKQENSITTIITDIEKKKAKLSLTNPRDAM